MSQVQNLFIHIYSPLPPTEDALIKVQDIIQAGRVRWDGVGV